MIISLLKLIFFCFFFRKILYSMIFVLYVPTLNLSNFTFHSFLFSFTTGFSFKIDPVSLKSDTRFYSFGNKSENPSLVEFPDNQQYRFFFLLILFAAVAFRGFVADTKFIRFTQSNE